MTAHTLRIAMAQFDFPVGAVAQNTDRIIEHIAAARDEFEADIVLFPELAISGYPPEDLLLRPGFLAHCEEALGRIAAATRGIVAVVGWPQSAGSVVYNAASVLRDGRIEATYRKRELPNYAVFDERRYFDVDPDGDNCVFTVKGVQVGVVICEDLWFAEPLANTVKARAELVLVPNASPYERGKHAQRDALLAERHTRERGGHCLSQRRWRAGRAGVRWRLGGGRWRRHRASRCCRVRGPVAGGWTTPPASAASPRWCGWTMATRVWTRWRGARLCAGCRTTAARTASAKVWLGLSGGIDSALVLCDRSGCAGRR